MTLFNSSSPENSRAPQERVSVIEAPIISGVIQEGDLSNAALAAQLQTMNARAAGATAASAMNGQGYVQEAA